MKNNYEIVHELKEEEKQGRLSSSTKESSKNSTSDENLDHTCFKNFFENAPIYEYMVSPKGTILEINKTVCTILGYKKEELIGKHLTAIYAPESHEKMNFLLSKWKETGEIDNEEMIIETKQGEKRRVLLSVSAVRGDDGAILYSISILKDVTEINKIYDELNKNLWLQNVKLQKLNETKKTFLKTTSHELRTPITSIKGYVQMLMKKTLGEINEEQRKSLEVILRNTNRLDQVIQNILDASTLESGIMKFIPRKVNPRILVEEITRTMEPFANKKEMIINVNLEKNLPDLIIDGERIKQVLMNLVDNAIKFSPDGSMIQIKARKEKEDVLFEVQDFGQGIPKDKQGMIFDTFYQVDSGDDRKFGGAGLSLALSKGIMKLHGGNIWFESTEGTGSTFLFTLPIQPIYDMKNTDLNDEMSLENMPEKSAGLAVNSVTMNTTDEEVSDSITEYKKITTTPKENEERYRALFNSSFELIYLHDLKGNFIDANPTALKLLGYSKEDLGSLNFSSLLDGGQIWKATKALNEIKKHGRQKELIEYRLKMKNGTFIDVETTAEIVYRDGKPYAIQGIARNITEQKQAKQILKESEEKYRSLFDSSPDLIIETDEKGNILAINPMMVKSIGVTSDKLIGKNIFDIFPREIAEERAKIATKALEEMKNQESKDERAGRYFQNIYVPIIHLDGKRTIQLIARDVTLQKKAEAILKESEERFRLLFDDVPVGIMLVDKNGIIKEANNSLLQLLSIQKEEFIGKNFVQLASTFGLEVTENITDFKNRLTEKPPKREITFLNKNNSKTTINVQSSAIKSSDEILGVLYYIEDITERKRVEEMLRLNEEKLRKIIDSSPDNITVTDLNGIIIDCNQAAADMIGFSTKEDIIGKNTLELIVLKDREKALEYLKKTLELGPVKNVEYTFLKKDGSEFPVEISASVIQDSSGKPLSFMAITKDITERKKAEQLLKESEEKLRRILDSSPDAITVTDLNGNIIECNQATSMMHGFNKKELIGKNALELFSPKDLERAKEGLKKTLESESVKNLEYTLLTKDGREFPAELSACLIKDTSGNPLSFVAITKDITERKRAEEELRESEKKFRAIFDNANDGFISVDFESRRFFNANKKMIEMLGYESEEEIKNLTISDIHPKKNLLYIQEEFEKHARGEISRSEGMPVKRKDGSIFFASISSSPLTVTNKTYLSCIFIDITNRKKAEKELKEKIDELERFKKLTVGREHKMIELKKEINELCKQMNQKPRYEGL